MLGVVTSFIEELRTSGVPVSISETIDALRAVEVAGVDDRSALRETLRATLVKSERHEPAFDTAFEAYFALLPSNEVTAPGVADGGGAGGGGGQGDTDALLDSLFRALVDMDAAGLRAGARWAVSAFAGLEPGRPVGGTYYLYRTLRRLGIDSLERRLAAELRERLTELNDLDLRLLGEEARARVGELKKIIEEDIRRRLVADRGSKAVARTLRRPLVEDVDLMHATAVELDAIEETIGPLTRKLAARLARRRRRRAGRLDFKRTMRRSLATGGVPADPQFRKPHPHRPEVFLLCDISGSMATFARFTLQFTYAMSTQFSKLRSFAFIDTVDEITDYFGPGVDFSSALQSMGREAKVVWLDGHSDYGNALETFRDNHLGEVGPRTTVIITGDARNNYRPARDEALRDIGAAARSLVWLNPEPRHYWDTGDSIMSSYARWCDSVHEVRTLRQLEVFVEQLTVPR